MFDVNMTIYTLTFKSERMLLNQHRTEQVPNDRFARDFKYCIPNYGN